MNMPEIFTERLYLTIPSVQFANQIATFAKINHTFHTPWEPPRSEDYFTSKYWENLLHQQQLDFQNKTSAKFFIFTKDKMEIVGYCNFSCFVRGVFQCTNLGFSLGENYQGYGYMSEALTAAIDYIFNKLKFHRIQANHLPNNYRSRNLLRKLGFVPEGYARDYLFIHNGWQDHVLNSLTNPKITSL